MNGSEYCKMTSFPEMEVIQVSVCDNGVIVDNYVEMGDFSDKKKKIKKVMNKLLN